MAKIPTLFKEGTTFEIIERDAGPRDLPAWARDAHINWYDGYGNRPQLKVRCRADPLAFSSFGNPAYDLREGGMWIAEQDGVASVHYHGGALRQTEFERHVRWLENPAQTNNWKGEAEIEKYTMLATTQQDGYAGRHFDITLKDGSNVRLRGPWHGGSPDGFMEINYDIDDSIARNAGRVNRWWRPWHARGGYFGLYIRPQVVLDIFSTFLAHIEWCWVIEPDGRRSLEPIRPETSMPKGWKVDVTDCPGHQFVKMGDKDHPWDACAFCERHRDLDYINPYKVKVA